MHVLGMPVPRVSGAIGHLARENAKRNPRRTAATASALMIGVFLVGFITILASSTKASTASAVEESLRHPRFEAARVSGGIGRCTAARSASMEGARPPCPRDPESTTDPPRSTGGEEMRPKAEQFRHGFGSAGRF